MNNTIKELKEEATEDIMGVPVLNAEMFAELIVKECSRVAMEYLDCPALAIKQHFGVE